MNGHEDRDTNDFRALGIVEEPVEAVDRSDARSGYRVFVAPDGFELAVPEQIIARALAWGRNAAPNEWYGLVVGRLGTDARGQHVTVLGLVPDHDARATPGYVETSHASEFATRERCRRLYPDGVIVGWVHGHHQCGARYSAPDRQNQATWTQPHSIGIVVDPWDPAELAVYRGPASERLAPRPARAVTSADLVTADVDFRALTFDAPDVVSSARAEERSTSGRRRARSTRLLAGLFLLLGVFGLVRDHRDRRSLAELTRRVRVLEARPLASRCPTPTPTGTPTASTTPGPRVVDGLTTPNERRAGTDTPRRSPSRLTTPSRR